MRIFSISKLFIWHSRQYLGWLYVVSTAGYEVEGLENVPVSQPALIIYYHGAVPVDLYYTVSTLELARSQQINLVGDRFLFHVPGVYTVCTDVPGVYTVCSDVPGVYTVCVYCV